MKRLLGVLGLIAGWSLLLYAISQDPMAKAQGRDYTPLTTDEVTRITIPVGCPVELDKLLAHYDLRVARLRGQMRAMQREMSAGFNGGAPPAGSIYRAVWDRAHEAIANDDMLRKHVFPPCTAPSPQ